MNNKSFTLWLDNNHSIGPSTVDKYSRAIRTISDEFLNGNSLYNISSYHEAYKVIKYLLEVNKFQEKNTRGHNMYSNALKQYLEYLKQNCE